MATYDTLNPTSSGLPYYSTSDLEKWTHKFSDDLLKVNKQFDDIDEWQKMGEKHFDSIRDDVFAQSLLVKGQAKGIKNIQDTMAGYQGQFDALDKILSGQDLDLEGLQGQLTGLFGHDGEGTKALQALWEKGGAGTHALDNLRDSLNVDWSNKTFGDEGMSMDEISNAITQQDQTTEGLQKQFTGLFEEGGQGAQAIDNIFSDQRLDDALSGLSDSLVDQYNLDGLSDMSDHIASNQADVRALGNRITGWESTAAQNKADVATALAEVGGLTTDLATATGDINQLRTDAQGWVDNLQMESDIDRTKIRQELQDQSNLWNQRLTDLSSSMDYKNLGDSATGVRTRKSKARASGQTRFGTGQLNRSMKLTSLNI